MRPATALASLHARGELRLLRLVGLALRLPARRVDGRRTTSSRVAHPPCRAAHGRARACSSSAVAFDLGLLAYFKYAGFFLSSAENMLSTLGLGGGDRRRVGRASGRHLVLHVHGDLVRRRRLPGELEPAPFGRFAVYLAFFPHLVAGPIVRGSELLPQLERPRDPTPWTRAGRCSSSSSGLFFKVVIANYLATRDRRRRLRGAERALVARGARRRLRLRGPDLRGLLRLHEHRDRRRAAARVHVPAELRLAVHRRRRSRTSGGAGT